MDVTADNDLGIPASGSICAALTPKEKEGKDFYERAYCQFSRDRDFSDLQVFDSTYLGQCALVAFRCQEIDQCEDYDEVKVVNNDEVEGHPLDSFEGPAAIDDDFSPIRNICEPNVCSNYEGEMTGKSCRLYEGFSQVECVSASDPCLNSAIGC